MEPDPVAFLESNPYNIRHHFMSIYGAADVLYHGRELTGEQREGLFYATLWHTPVWAAHIAHRFGVLGTAGHVGGFGYFKSLEMFPGLQLALAYYTVGREVVAAPYRSVRFTAGDDMRKHVGGGLSFRNPISGM